MKGWTLALLLLAALALTSATSKKLVKKAHSDSDKKHVADMQRKLDQLLELEAELESEIAAAENDEENAADNEVVEEEEEESSDEENEMLDAPQYIPDETESYPDPCAEMYCGAGRICVVTDEGEGECRCVNNCDVEEDPRRRVCSNHNETWMSDCELYRQRCLCEEEDTSCLNSKYKHVHIEYFGECQDVPECEEDELEDFPRRFSEWLFNIMRNMADRQTLSEHYVRLEREAEEHPEKQWPYAVVWKWCQLDSHPKDRAVSRHELFPVRAPLYTLEHCVGHFLDSCDGNNDHSITIREWAKCTKLSEDQIDQLEDMCEDITE